MIICRFCSWIKESIIYYSKPKEPTPTKFIILNELKFCSNIFIYSLFLLRITDFLYKKYSLYYIIFVYICLLTLRNLPKESQ